MLELRYNKKSYWMNIACFCIVMTTQESLCLIVMFEAIANLRTTACVLLCRVPCWSFSSWAKSILKNQDRVRSSLMIPVSAGNTQQNELVTSDSLLVSGPSATMFRPSDRRTGIFVWLVSVWVFQQGEHVFTLGFFTATGLWQCQDSVRRHKMSTRVMRPARMFTDIWRACV